MNPVPQKHSKPLLLIIAAVFGLCGLLAGINALASVSRLSSGDKFHFTIPGLHQVTIKEPGKYRLWAETNVVVNGQLRTFADELPPGSTIEVSSVPDGKQVPLETGMTATVSTGSSRRVSKAAVTFPRAGEYQILATSADLDRPMFLAKAELLNGMVRIIGFGALAAVLMLIALVLLIVYVATRPKVPIVNTAPPPPLPTDAR